MITVIQNYICTVNERKEALLNNLPQLGKVFKDVDFYVNFNDTVNLEVIHNSYKENIPKLNFYNNPIPSFFLMIDSIQEIMFYFYLVMKFQHHLFFYVDLYL